MRRVGKIERCEDFSRGVWFALETVPYGFTRKKRRQKDGPFLPCTTVAPENSNQTTRTECIRRLTRHLNPMEERSHNKVRGHRVNAGEQFSSYIRPTAEPAGEVRRVCCCI
jgi:hypothetical protein